MLDIFTSTVAAVSTAHGKAGIAVIRVTGSETLRIVPQVFRPRSGKKLTDYPPAHAVYGDLYDADGNAFDSGICTVFRAPHSYTGEDTAEISCHGSDLCASYLLGALLAAGAKSAGPGEFTRRAFLNGKLDLMQAEAVAELIDAESTAALRLSNAQTAGKLSEELGALSKTLTDVLSSVYAAIDYPDEDLAELPPAEMRAALETVKERLHLLCKSYASGRAVMGGIKTVIAGIPNSGKSSVMNLLVGSERAIVTDVAGTTRDVITEKAFLGNITLLLSDTAGIRDTGDTVEKIGVARAREALCGAELILAVTDGTVPLSYEEEALFSKLAKTENRQVLILLNKSDLGAPSLEKTARLRQLGFQETSFVSLSAKTGDGRDRLVSAIDRLYPAGDAFVASGLVITNARVYAAVRNAYDAVSDGISALDRYSPDVAGTDIERAAAFLEETDGRRVTEEIVDGIFSRFCVGK